MGLTSSQFTNLLWKKKKAKFLEQENRSLRRQRNTAYTGLIGLAALSICSIASCRQKEAALFASQQEKADMKATAEYFQKDAADLSLENQRLKGYEDFTHSINVFYPDVLDEAIPEEEKLQENENLQNQKKWFDACDTLGIDYETLMRLKQGTYSK